MPLHGSRMRPFYSKSILQTENTICSHLVATTGQAHDERSELQEATSEHASATLEEYASRVAAKAPELTPDALRRLRQLLSRKTKTCSGG